MKGFIRIAALLLCAMLFMATACTGAEKPISTPEPTEAITPPARKAGKMLVTYPYGPYSFTDAFINADAVYALTVGNWLGETDEGLGVTFFEASIERVYKGEELTSIVLVQEGTSKATIPGYPLFTAGNRVLLFLGKWIDNSEYKNAFHIIGGSASVCDIVELSNGEQFVIDRQGYLTKEENEAEFVSNKLKDYPAVYAAYAEYDPILAEWDCFSRTRYAHSLDDIDAYFKAQDVD